MARVGFYGGTFDPPHLGHTEAAEAFIKELSLDRLTVIPAYCQPGKDGTAADAPSRLAMTALAFPSQMGRCRVEVSGIECEQEEKSFTADTVETLTRGSDDTFFLLVGADKLKNILQWHRLYDLLQAVCLCVIPRDGENVSPEVLETLCRTYQARVAVLKTVPASVSSTEIRAALAGGHSPDALSLSPAVASYIKEKELYR